MVGGQSFSGSKFGWFGQGVKSARGATAILAAATTPETCLERPFTRTIAKELLQTKQQNACKTFRPLRTIASHELLHELLRQKTSIAATPLAESTPSPNCQDISTKPLANPAVSIGKRHPLEKGSFQRGPFSRDSRDIRDSRDCGREPLREGISDHCLEILEIASVNSPFCNDPFFRIPTQCLAVVERGHVKKLQHVIAEDSAAERPRFPIGWPIARTQKLFQT